MRTPLPVFLSCVVTLLTAGCSPPVPVGTTEQASPGSSSRPVPVRTVSVTSVSTSRTTTQPAAIHAYFETEIRAKVTGYVDQLKVDIGDAVDVNALLATISVPELAKQREVLLARVERYRAEEARAESGVKLAEANVLSSQARFQQAQAEAERSNALLAALEFEFTRTADLVERRSIEPRILDEVRKRRDAEIANRAAADSAIRSAEAEVVVAEAKQKSAEADLAAAKAETTISLKQLDELDVQIGYTSLKAPFPGVITHREVNPGDLVREQSTGAPLFMVSQVNKVRVRVHVPEADAPYVTRGDELTLALPGFPEEKFQTTISRVSQSLDQSTRTMLVEAEIDNPDGKLLPGMFGQATITLGGAAVARVLPSRAVRYDAGGQAFVYLVSEDDAVSKTSIRVGNDTGESIEVVEGLAEGQVVIDHHLKRFQDGQKIHRLD